MVGVAGAVQAAYQVGADGVDIAVHRDGAESQVGVEYPVGADGVASVLGAVYQGLAASHLSQE